jgi:rhodanese-related sulfurtransferase
MCHHGVRSMHGASILIQAGLTQVCSMSGGIDRWSIKVDPKVPRY